MVKCIKTRSLIIDDVLDILKKAIKIRKERK